MSLSKSEQARINGANSRGPKTAGGKARSSQNAITHGIFAKNVVLAGESKQDFDLFVQRYVARFQPADEPELNLVEQMVHCTWRKHRLLLIGKALFETMLHEADPPSTLSNSATTP